MALTTVSVIMTVTVLNFFYRGPNLTPVPAWARRYGGVRWGGGGVRGRKVRGWGGGGSQPRKEMKIIYIYGAEIGFKFHSLLCPFKGAQP
jgi:hypothetical protein